MRRCWQVLRGADGVHRHLAAGKLGEAEVKYLHLPARREKNVRRFDVAMNDAFGVRGVEGVGKLNGDVEHAIERQGTGSQFPVKAFALQQLHGDEGLIAFILDGGLLYGIDRADVGMVQRRGGAGFEQESIKCSLIF